jgi:hypothetical protein
MRGLPDLRRIGEPSRSQPVVTLAGRSERPRRRDLLEAGNVVAGDAADVAIPRPRERRGAPSTSNPTWQWTQRASGQRRLHHRVAQWGSGWCAAPSVVVARPRAAVARGAAEVVGPVPFEEAARMGERLRLALEAWILGDRWQEVQRSTTSPPE